ncbi:MAG: SRPBCC domain-containing protein [Burkholderiales bacterium]|nr:SRPBCC domain-containing protein [Burkholderiales bacterium]
MSTTERIEFSTDIAAPVATVFRLMLDPQGYRDWTTPFAEGSHYVGSWQQGQKIHFLSPSGDGMVSEIAEYRPDAYVSIRHLGYVAQGVEDTQSDAVRAWAPAYENYRFLATSTGTRLVIEQDATPEFKAYLAEAWPKALQRLKTLCEAAAR